MPPEMLRPAPHRSHEWPFMPNRYSRCTLCNCSHGSYEAQSPCRPAMIYGDDPQADAEEGYTLGPC